jgi:asparagine synthase (glutamine-hydrolysing)
VLAKATETLAHRGPDGSGMLLEGSIGLGFRRLAIFDLSDLSSQPMESADGRHVIVFNGAIYNFVELREQLRALGHAFRSTGDTEVLLAAWRQWGADCLPRLNGMWAFLIYDRHERRLFGARDRFGVKPMFMRRDATGLMFASEIKALASLSSDPLSLDHRAIAEYLIDDRLDSSERTVYSGVSRIPAGTAFEVDEHARMRSWSYWSLMESAAAVELPAEPALEYATLFEDAIRLRMRSDVPVGVLLSGGLDSSSIVCAVGRQLGPRETRAAPLLGICYMDPEFDERPFIEATLEQSGATLARLQTGPRELWDSLSEHLWYQDEPVHSFSSVVVFQLMKLARQQGIKVVLNGQGADEVLGGYGSYFVDFLLGKILAGRCGAALRDANAYARRNSISAVGLLRRALNMYVSQQLNRLPAYRAMAQRRRRSALSAHGWVSPEILQHWRPIEIAPGSLSTALRSCVEQAHLPLYLRTEDRNSMAHGVEVRLPFLDYRLVALAFRLGDEWKFSGENTKVLLREAMRQRIPESVRTRGQKFGFPTAAASWFRQELRAPLQDLLASRAVRECGFWNLRQVERDLRRHQRGDVNLSGRLFDVVQLSLLAGGFTTSQRTHPLQGAQATLRNAGLLA